jgi:ABC-type multidrug transport system fused ATPase/permease subunit
LMEDGRILERGTHAALMEARGLYYDMVLRQMTAHEDASEFTMKP